MFCPLIFDAFCALFTDKSKSCPFNTNVPPPPPPIISFSLSKGATTSGLELAPGYSPIRPIVGPEIIPPLANSFGLVDNLDLKLHGDYVRASNLDNSQALPRITPLRLGAGLHYQKNALGARIDMLHAFKQNRTAENELATDGYTDVSALVTYKLPVKLNMELFAKANNLLNQEIREHSSFLKDLSPAGERSVLIGMRADF